MDRLVYLTSEQNAFANTDDLFRLSVSCQVKKNYRVCRFCVMNYKHCNGEGLHSLLDVLCPILYIQCSSLNALNRIEFSLYNNRQISIP